MTLPIEPTTRDNLTVPVSVCAICDAGKDPLDVPGVSCGHSGEQRRTVLVEVVPKAEVERLRDALFEADIALVRGNVEFARQIIHATRGRTDVPAMSKAEEYRRAWKLCRDEYAELEDEVGRLREALLYIRGYDVPGYEPHLLPVEVARKVLGG